ncbi:adenylate kinase family protein [[Eubacterium] cellulosolvens]
MNVALTGTPGTGKSTVSKQLRNEGYQVLDVNDIALTEKFVVAYDEARATNEVDLEALNDHLQKYIKEMDKDGESSGSSPELIILEGHLAHLLDFIELVIILRCHPAELQRRLESKSWPEQKIRENLEAEALDAITIECVNKYSQDKIFEIDTTCVEPHKIMEKILDVINGRVDGYSPGKIDWSEEILKWY